MKKIDGNNLIVDHSRDPEENKGSHCWQKKTELLFVMRLNHQLNNKLEISDIFIYISLKIRAKIVIKVSCKLNAPFRRIYHFCS